MAKIVIDAKVQAPIQLGATQMGIGVGPPGATPEIIGGNWWIAGVDTGVVAEGVGIDNVVDNGDGTFTLNFTDGSSFTTPNFNGDTPEIIGGNWWIGGVDTGVKAEGSDGDTPEIGINDNWWIGGVDTGVKAVNVQADWNQTVNTEDDYIKNKPIIPAAQVNSDWDATGGVEEILNKPVIPDAQVNSDWDATGGVEEILNKPTLGDAAGKNVGTGENDVAAGNDSRFPTTDEKAALAGTGTPSGANKYVTEDGIPSVPSKASAAEVDTGTDDVKYVTSKGIKDAKNVPNVAPGTAGNVLTSDGTDWTSAAPTGGGASNSVEYGTELTGASNLTRANHNFKTTFFNDSTDRDLELKKADWQEGDWFVIRQFGDGQATIVPEDGNVHLPDTDTTRGKGLDTYLECYKVDGDDIYFHIVGGAS